MFERVAMNQRLSTAGQVGTEFDAAAATVSTRKTDHRTITLVEGSFNKASFNCQGASEEVDGAFDRSTSTTQSEDGYRDVQRLVLENALCGELWTQNWSWVVNTRVFAASSGPTPAYGISGRCGVTNSAGQLTIR